MFFWGIFFFASLSSFTLHRTLASDADHRRPLEPAGVEGDAVDEVEVVPVWQQGRSQSTHVRLAIQNAGSGKPRKLTRRRNLRAVRVRQ